MRILSGNFAALFLCLLLLSGCTRTQLFLANLPSNLGDYTLHEDIAYGPEEWQKLDVYVPDLEGDKPVVLYIYGGKWREGDKDDYKFVGEALASRGYVAVIADYIKYPGGRFPQFVKDEALAAKWLYRYIRRYGGDNDNIFIAGHSAGAHIAGLLGADERYLDYEGVPPDSIKGIIGISGPYAFNPSEHYLSKTFGGEENFPDSQVINFIDGKEPPFLLLHGEKDNVVQPLQSQLLTERIREKGGKAKLIFYRNLDHRGPVAAFTRFFRRDRELLPDIIEFIEQNRS